MMIHPAVCCWFVGWCLCLSYFCLPAHSPDCFYKISFWSWFSAS